MSHRHNESRIYVGNLPPDIRTKDIQDLFHKFGKVTFVDLKNRRGPPFAFVEFEDSRYVRLDTNNRSNIKFCCCWFFSLVQIYHFVSVTRTSAPLPRCLYQSVPLPYTVNVLNLSLKSMCD